LFLNRDDYLRMRHEYYTLRGWRPEAGLPKSRDVEPAGFGWRGFAAVGWKI